MSVAILGYIYRYAATAPDPERQASVDTLVHESDADQKCVVPDMFCLWWLFVADDGRY